MRFLVFYLFSIFNFYWNYQDFLEFDDSVNVHVIVCEIPKHFFEKHFTRFCVFKIDDQFQFGSFYYQGDQAFNFLDVLLIKGEFELCLNFEDKFCRSKMSVHEFGQLHELDVIKTYFRGIKFFDFTSFFMNNFSLDQSRLILGMLFGNQLVFDYDQMQLFYRSQVSHLIVASGQNIAFIIDFIMLGLAYVPRFFHGVLIYPILFFYFFIVGFSPPILRAIIMFYLLKKIPKISKTHLVLFGIYLICIYWPFAIFFSISLQMSLIAFIAVLFAIDFFELNKEKSEFYKLFLILLMSNLFIFIYLLLIDFDFNLYGFLVNFFLIPFLYTLDLLIVIYFSLLLFYDFIYLKFLISMNLDLLWQLFDLENLINQNFYIFAVISIFFFVFLKRYLK